MTTLIAAIVNFIIQRKMELRGVKQLSKFTKLVRGNPILFLEHWAASRCNMWYSNLHTSWACSEKDIKYYIQSSYISTWFTVGT